MPDTDRQKRLRAALSAWLETNLPWVCDDHPPHELPVVVDFFLVVAIEDAADEDTDTWYSIITSGCSHYRKVGLVSCAKAMLIRDDEEDE